MDTNRKGGPKVPVDRVNKAVASRPPEEGMDRPGFDLGGAIHDKVPSQAGGNVRPTGRLIGTPSGRSANDRDGHDGGAGPRAEGVEREDARRRHQGE